MVQFEMPFDDGACAGRVNDGCEPVPQEAEGLLTSRAWTPAHVPAADVLESVRRMLPLTRPVSDHLVALIVIRGYTEPDQLEQFFFPTLDRLHDPRSLEEMDGAVDRLLAAAAAGQKVAVHGDFDVDGLTGTAILGELFTVLNVSGRRMELCAPFVPDRLKDGYGVAKSKLRAWGKEHVDLLVTVDTGSAAHEELNLARELGMDVVVLDHHIFDRRPEAATVLVNPRRKGNRYPNSELCGAAVAFKLVQAIQARSPESLPDDFSATVLDLAALGTIADQMTLVVRTAPWFCEVWSGSATGRSSGPVWPR